MRHAFAGLPLYAICNLHALMWANAWGSLLECHDPSTRSLDGLSLTGIQLAQLEGMLRLQIKAGMLSLPMARSFCNCNVSKIP